MSNEFKLVPVEPILSIADRIKFNCPKAAIELEQILAAAPQPPALGGEPETAAWLDLEKLKIGNMAYATGMKVNHRQTELIDRAHLAPLQAEIGRLERRCENAELALKHQTDNYENSAAKCDQLKARCDELEKDEVLLDYLQDQLVDTIYLDDGRIIDIAGRLTVREGVHAHMSKPAGSEQV